MNDLLITRTDLRTGTIVEETYLRGDICHRNTSAGPAHILRDAVTKIVTLEEFKFRGEYHRARGPAIIERHRETGHIVREVYFLRNRRHRRGGPAAIEYDGTPDIRMNAVPTRLNSDGKQGAVLCEEYFRADHLHRDPRRGPAVQCRDPATGIVTEVGYVVATGYHRDPSEGPAYIRYDRRTGKVVESHGGSQSDRELAEAAQLIEWPRRRPSARSAKPAPVGAEPT